MTPPEDLRRRIPQIAKLLDRETVKAAIEARGRAVVERVIQAQIGRAAPLRRGERRGRVRTRARGPGPGHRRGQRPVPPPIP